ncbi:MAG: ComEC/Rec2 family competence protein [Chloroflexota bacterium]
MSLLILAVAWMVGILVADLYHIDQSLWLSAGVIGVVGVAVFVRVRRPRLVALVICCIALGGFRYGLAQVETTPQSIWQFNETGNIVLQGVVIEDSRRTEEGQRLLIDAEVIAINGTTTQVEGSVLVKLPPYPERRYGDRLTLHGELTTPRAADRPGLFDYQEYLARKYIFALMEPTAAGFVSQGHGNQLWSALLELRDWSRYILLRELPEPEASLAVGILLGLQSSIPDDVYETFSITGTSHILVISGWNITIIALALYPIAERLQLSKGSTFWVILVCIWLYTLFVGATPTVIRAAVMGSVAVLGQRLGRRSHAWTTLFAACWAMTIWDPQTLWDLGFQLSALATASLFAYGNGVDRMLLRTPLRTSWLGWAREALTATIAAQILALPLILYHFGNLSIVAPLANVVMLPMVPYAMLFGAIALVVGMVYLPAGQWLATFAYLFLAWLTVGARIFAELPWAAMQVPPFPLWLLLGYYIIVIGAWLLHEPEDDGEDLVDIQTSEIHRGEAA